MNTGGTANELRSDVCSLSVPASLSSLHQAKSVESEQLPPAVTNDPTDARYFHSVTRRFQFPEGASPERVTVRVRLRPMGLDVIDDLIATGDLDPSLRARIPVYDLGGTKVEWRASSHVPCVTP